ncbi:MAG TPA: 4-hydroxy-tetrahydrodipicolinate reductase [Phycisphaerae bacterium]|nr:4-hydroxy-tetrahydrodipicolinate reductase [Phycisphaerae bacterium]
MTPVRLIVAGCCGRMGRAVVRRAAGEGDLRIVSAVTEASDPAIGQDAGVAAGARAIGVAIESTPAAGDVLVDFTSPDGSAAWAEWCAANGVALVSGTTGLSSAHQAALDRAAERSPVLWSPNMSIGVHLLARLVEEATRRLDSTWDIEVVEIHHRHKADAPSGTARMLLERICAARGSDPAAAATHGRRGERATRRPGEIGLHALRLGSVVGDHQVYFGGPDEVLTIAHQAASRDIFAAGALRVARWIAGRPPGRYTMQDVLS